MVSQKTSKNQTGSKTRRQCITVKIPNPSGLLCGDLPNFAAHLKEAHDKNHHHIPTCFSDLVARVTIHVHRVSFHYEKCSLLRHGNWTGWSLKKLCAPSQANTRTIIVTSTAAPRVKIQSRVRDMCRSRTPHDSLDIEDLCQRVALMDRPKFRRILNKGTTYNG